MERTIAKHAVGSSLVTAVGIVLMLASVVTQAAFADSVPTVTNLVSGKNLSAMNTTTSTVMSATAPLPTTPVGIAITPNGAFAYVATPSADAVSVINTATNRVSASVPVGSQPQHVAISPNGAFAYVTTPSANAVSVINTATNKVSASVPVGTQPQYVAISPNGAFAYASNQLSFTVSVINTATNTVSATLFVHNPGGVAITPDGAFAYVTNYTAGTVSVINTVANKVTATVPVGANPSSIAINPKRAFAYVTNNTSSTVSVINTTTNAVVATVLLPLGSRPCCVAITPNGDFAYIANQSPNTLSVINTTTNTMSDSVMLRTGSHPTGIAITPNGAFAYVNLSSNTVSVVNTATKAIVATVPVATIPSGNTIPPSVDSQPTADAGTDQAVRAGDLVELDGTASFDDNTPAASLAYSWSLSLSPAGSATVLLGSNTATPSLVADVSGQYVVDLVVTDEDALASTADQVAIGSNVYNLAPTAVAGPDQLVFTGATVKLSSASSRDPENDPLLLQWALSTVPNGSTAALSGAATPTPSFVADLEGVYDCKLTITDSTGSTSDSVIVVATTAEGFEDFKVVAANDVVMGLTPGQVTTRGNQVAFSNFLIQAIVATQTGNVATAIDKLQKAIAKTDGCMRRGAPDQPGPGRDWITDCEEQVHLYELVNEALKALTP